MSVRFDDWEGEHLAHYGVLGMKWGQRRYQNPDGSLTAAGKKRYEKTGEYGYQYHSHATKKYQRKALKASNKAGKIMDKEPTEKNQRKASKLISKSEKMLQRANRSAELDRREQAAAERISTGKAIATRLLLSPASSKAYQQYRAMAGGGEHGAATKTMARVLSWYGGTAGSRIAKAAYIRKGEKDRGLANTINKAGSKTVQNLRKEDEAMRGLGYIAKAGVMDSVNQARSMRTGQPYKSLIPKVATKEEERRAARSTQQAVQKQTGDGQSSKRNSRGLTSKQAALEDAWSAASKKYEQARDERARHVTDIGGKRYKAMKEAQKEMGDAAERFFNSMSEAERKRYHDKYLN